LTPEEQQAVAWFPALAGDAVFKKTSDKTAGYNCIAFAAGDDTEWWWPIQGLGRKVYWPGWAPRQLTLAAFVAVFEGLGYRRCRNGARKRGTEKIAIYVDAAGVPTHAAIQTEDGLWQSKLGSFIDIRHSAVDLLTGYGTVAVYMQRRLHGDSLIARLWHRLTRQP
jgi:hypothetical protein